MSSAGIKDRNIIIKLVPWLLSVTMYFALRIPYESPSLLAVIIKCLPIFSLMYFVKTAGCQKRSAYSSKILAGLICCSIGDAFLLWKNCFIYGMFAFMLGHLNYILAFGFTPIKLKLGITLFFIGVLVIGFLYNGLSGVLLIGVPIYIFVLDTMLWRGIARVQDKWTWIRMSTCLGSMLFATSDLIIGIDKFVRPIAHSQVLIMSSYYAAQLGISLGVLEN